MKTLSDFLFQLGLKSNEIKTLREDDGTVCLNCKIRHTSNWAVLKPCDHKICFTCLDNLYDNHEVSLINDSETLCVCPFCNIHITDWENM